jgi:SAM-dependent methyltransferase
MELLIGCGASREKKVTFDEIPKEWSNKLITLDWDESSNPDVLHDLNILPYPFEDDQFEEIHAYEVLEHLSTQGDFRFFFQQFEEFHRILKPGGWFIGTCPVWHDAWAWGDPGHTRIISQESLIFLSQQEYITQIDEEKRAMTDYRGIYEADFELVSRNEPENSPNWAFVLKAIK